MKIDKYMQEDPYPDIPEVESSEKPKINKIIYCLIGLVLFLVVVFALFFIPSRESVCGNYVCEVDENCFDCSDDCKCREGEICSEEKKLCVKVEDEKGKYGDGVCDTGENCWDHPKDCKCMGEEYCSHEEKKCVKPVCGNGKCEGGGNEEPYSCCLDCKCIIPGEICNEETKKCEIQEMEISDVRATELAITYFENSPDYQDLEINSTEVTGVSMYNEELVKIIRVQISGQEWFVYLGVTEDEKVIVLPVF